jgi:hypothetical protein
MAVRGLHVLPYVCLKISIYLTFTGLISSVMASAQQNKGILRCGWRDLFCVGVILRQLNRTTYLTVFEKNGDLRVTFGSRRQEWPGGFRK